MGSFSAWFGGISFFSFIFLFIVITYFLSTVNGETEKKGNKGTEKKETEKEKKEENGEEKDEKQEEGKEKEGKKEGKNGEGENEKEKGKEPAE